MTTLVSRLSLYPKPLRKEPKPQRARSVTIAAGFRCFDGVLLVADTQHTSGYEKFADQKIWTVECGDFAGGPKPSMLLVAGAGVDAFIIDAVNRLKSDAELQRKVVSFENVERAIQRAASGAKQSVLLVGVKIRTDDYARLLRVERAEGKTRILPTPIPPQPGKGWTFTGTDVVETLCGEMADWLCSEGLPVFAMRETAKEMLKRMASRGLYCNPPIQVDFLLDTYAPRLEAARRMVNSLPEDFLAGALYQFGHVLRSCADHTLATEEFVESVRVLGETLRQIRVRLLSH